MGLIAMGERDLQRIEVLSKVIGGRMTMVSAAHVLGLSERQVRRLLQRMRTGGAASIRHKAIGQTSNNRLGNVLAYIKEQQDKPKVKSNSEKNGYVERARGPGRRKEFMSDPAVIARREKALLRQRAAE